MLAIVPGDQVSRRRVLLGLGAALLVSGCSSALPAGDEPLDAPTVDPDREIRQAAADAERALLAAYAATVARHPALTERLAVLSAQHDDIWPHSPTHKLRRRGRVKPLPRLLYS